MSAGLWPMPNRCALQPEIFGRLEREGYSVEKVLFRSYPGFLVTGNLYRPRGKQEPFPGIITPHGHWSAGRLAHEANGSVPGRCINLARQGNVVFSYDMVGYNDSKQVSHQFGGPREELWGISLLGLQLWNSIRAIDFLLTLPDVDPERIACTGASGGGTQTFLVMAVDERVKVAAPVNMVSAHMQGGCLCENAPNLRVDTFNTEIAALMAPRPLLLVSATGDWTKNNPVEEAPDIRSIYDLYGATERFECVQFDAPHNYNQDSREAVYAFLGKWLQGIDDAAAFKEQAFEPEPNEKLLVFADRDLPEDAITQEELVANLMAASEAQLAAYRPTSRSSLKQFGEVYGSALFHALNLRPAPGSELPPVPRKVLTPQGTRYPRAAVVVIADRPMADMEHHPVVQELLRRERTVILADCFLIGDNQLAKGSERNREAKYFTTYNRTDTALRVQDIVHLLQEQKQAYRSLSLVGLGEAGLWCLLASAASLQLAAVVADLNGLDPGSDEELLARLFTPGLRRAGDLRTAGALWAPTKLFLHNGGSDYGFEFIQDAYRAAGTPNKLRIVEGPANAAAIVDWVTH
ncbi:MAG: alpha/beta hydrolase family protein [Candidatus Zipacnadales bacterium]